MIGWVGDKIEDLSLGISADADFAGRAQSLRSTSGSHFPNTASIVNIVVAKFKLILPFSLSNLLVKISYKVNLLSK